MSFYRIAINAVHGIMRVVLLYKIRGKENIPNEGAFLLCSNHRSWIDPVLIAAGSPRQLTFMAKEELFSVPVIGRLIKALGAFPIKRGRGDAAAVMATLKIMKRGGATLIFPEGTRTKTGEMGRFKAGAFKIAMDMGLPVVPITLNGFYKSMPPGQFFANLDSHVSLHIGKPIDISQFTDINEAMSAVREKVVERLN